MATKLKTKKKERNGKHWLLKKDCKGAKRGILKECLGLGSLLEILSR